MSEAQNGAQRNDDEGDFAELEQTLRSILGDKAAAEIISAMRDKGLNSAASPFGLPGMPFLPGMDSIQGMPHIFTGENFTVISQQIQSMLGADGKGPVNWKIAEEVARQTVVQKNLDSLSNATADEARNALRTASLWLDAATEFGPVTGTNMAWNRLDWIAHSLPTFKRLMDPVGAHITAAISRSIKNQLADAPEEMQQMLGMMGDPAALLGSAIGSVLGIQYGSALAQLASNSFGTSDTGLPLMEASTAALVPTNIANFAKDLEIDASEVLAYIAVRELAAARLFTHVPWLRTRILDTVAEYAPGIEIDTEAIEEKVREMTFENPQSMGQIDLTDIFALEISPSQQEVLNRLEHLISLVEGWVSEVSARAVAPHLPNAMALREMFARRYATDNPAKGVWEMQLGMELTPRNMRAAVTFWQLAETHLGSAERDALWNHPDLLPSAAALNGDITAFFQDAPANDISAELDSFLADLFNESAKPANSDPAADPDTQKPEDDTTTD
ncbi:zinc-dependent metalloprotease [Arcanobacterium hippocoleae]|uniref:Hydrolase n=1 Tax=Arcanobacterium hippocoleae TaxID=149017 RepID=A0ABU1T1K4_9ACTO|nr:zinc-dependent metalloprotease [Arcanobacterium hippocoleae]MDR6939257.1 putative hydrolase [Arcanobacterium hippocoleae]